jgi:hypothetical protein
MRPCSSCPSCSVGGEKVLSEIREQQAKIADYENLISNYYYFLLLGTYYYHPVGHRQIRSPGTLKLLQRTTRMNAEFLI